MTKPKINSEVRAEQAASKTTKAHQTIKLGLDVHADTIVVVRILDEATARHSPRKSSPPPNFSSGCRHKVRSWPTRCIAATYEVSPFGYGLHRDLIKIGVQNVVVQPVCLDERRTGVNHDKE